jgi:hypothetical protein
VTIVATIDEPPAAAQLAASIANCRAYLAQHPCADYHLDILLGAMLAALQTYANHATEETIRAALAEVVEPDDDEPLPDARLNS